MTQIDTPLTAVMTREVFLAWRKDYRLHTDASIRLPMFGTGSVDDPDESKDILFQRADLAQWIRDTARGSENVAILINYTDCDGHSGHKWRVIRANVTSYRGMEQEEHDASDGTFSLSITNEDIVSCFAPKWVQDAISQ